MKTFRLHPYMRPAIKSFENKKFQERSKVIFDFIKKSALKGVFTAQDKHWVFVGYNRKINPSEPKSGWMPKVYICVSPADYWEVIVSLVAITPDMKLSWKFCKNLETFARPDKIVLYFHSSSELKKFVKKIKPFLKGKKSHQLKFALSLGSGIFAGVDPTFLKTSWRYYRWALDESIIKENKKKVPLTKEVREALKKLNINLKNEGPLKLNPSSKNNKFIKKLWKEVNS